jgi:spore photoproduct lyase
MMIKLENRIKQIYLFKSAQPYPLTQKVIDNLPGVPIEMITTDQELEEILSLQKDPIGYGKSRLVLKPLKGDFVKPCPCTPCYLGCRYHVIHADLNCPMDCTYCILQLYLNQPWLTIHVNTNDMWRQLDSYLKANDRSIRIGTGELGDSLALDSLTGRSPGLIEYFRERPRVFFELKTKTVNIDHILNTPAADNIIIAWSLNSFEAARKEEKRTPSVPARIQAAEQVIQKGYRVAFHFDPLILYPGWEDGYREVIELLMSRIDPKKVAWISLGSLRFPPALKPVVQNRFPDSKIIYEELVKGKDGKLRYFKPKRIKLYRKIISYFGDRKKSLPLYFCMESEEIWKKGLQKKMGSEVEIERFLTSLPR